MRHPDGGFWSSQDADSEGVEGRFYVWGWDELLALVEEPVAVYLGASAAGNWEGTNVLWRPAPLRDVAARFGLEDDELDSKVRTARTALFEAREARARPGTDDKVLASWNGLAIRALAEAGRAFRTPTFVEAAVDAATFVLRELRDDAERLCRSWRDGVVGRPGFADDHAAMATACLTLYETTFESRWFEEALRLGDELMSRFHDAANGGFFQTASDAESRVVRPKDLYDNATPGGNGSAAEALLRLSLLTGDRRYDAAAEGALRLVAPAMARAPSGFGTSLCALDLYLGPSREVAIAGDRGDPATWALADQVTTAAYRPNVVMAVGDAADPVPLLRDRTPVDGRPAAYVCERFACRLPVTETEDLRTALDAI